LQSADLKLNAAALADIRLLVSELVTAAVRAPDAGPVTVEVEELPSVVRVRVRDVPRLKAVTRWLVHGLAKRWGRVGSEVWFEVVTA
jgi:hypothetical protein